MNNVNKILNVRPLKASEIEIRVGSNSNTGYKMLLLYKNARVDMTLLDETVGPMNWQRSHEVIGGNLFCKISIYDETKDQWISKEDVGVESRSEKAKGQASDSFKRAGFNWGIGRELYTAPPIFVSSSSNYFKVISIGYDEDRNITDLQIADAKTNTIVYELKNGKQVRLQQNYNNVANTSNNGSKKTTINKPNTSGKTCSKCGTTVTDSVAWYSNTHYKQVLCMDCQPK